MMMASTDDGAFDNDGSDSFHSFNESEISHRLNLSASWKSSLASDCDSATGFESEHETSGSLEDEYSIQAQPQTPTNALFDMPLPKSSDQKSECTSDSSACDGVSNNNGSRLQLERFKTLKKFAVSPLNGTEVPLPICPRKVPELASKQVPDEELFDLDSPQLRPENFLSCNEQELADRKNAFTNIWVDYHHDLDKATRSPIREFSGALDAYFKQDLTKMTSEKQDNNIVPPVTKPAKTIIAPVTNVVVKPAEEYVSPFKNMPIQAAPPKETSLLDGAKKPTIVPAGFDLDRLVEYKNPNHWARRKHVRTGDMVF